MSISLLRVRGTGSKTMWLLSALGKRARFKEIFARYVFVGNCCPIFDRDFVIVPPTSAFRKSQSARREPPFMAALDFKAKLRQNYT